MNPAVWISNNALWIALVIIFIILIYKFIEWYFNNQNKIEEFMSKFRKKKEVKK